MTDIGLLQAQYKIGNLRAVVDAATEDEIISLQPTFDQVVASLEGLSGHANHANKDLDPENFAALKELLGVDLDSAQAFDADAQIKVSPDVFVRVGQWNEGAIDREELDLLKERVAAYNEGKIYAVTFNDNPADGEAYFESHEEIAEHLAECYMLHREESLEEDGESNGYGRGDEDGDGHGR